MSANSLLAQANSGGTWPLAYAGWDLPLAVLLIAVVSLVYAATRHENLIDIQRHAVRLGATIVVFMGIVFGVLVFVSWLLAT